MQKKFTLFSSCIKECRSSFVMILLEYSSTDNLMLSTMVTRKESVKTRTLTCRLSQKKVAELRLNQQYSPEQNRSGLVLLNLYICRWCDYFLFIFSVMSRHVHFVYLTFLKKKKISQVVPMEMIPLLNKNTLRSKSETYKHLCDWSETTVIWFFSIQQRKTERENWG